MDLAGKNIVLTGAAGGIGSNIALQLADKGARLALLERDAQALQELARQIETRGGNAECFVVDLLDRDARDRVISDIDQRFGSIDVLINAAGTMSYRPFAEEDPVVLERILQLNTIAPMMLTRKILPGMLERNTGRVVNIGSTFGSIAFAWFSAYSASKFALRGFSEALRRELADSGIGVTYIAPRAVKTSLNTEAVYQMAEATGMNMDSPEWVAERVIKAIERDRKDVYLGFPESLFVRINALLPRLVDSALRKQNRTMSLFAKGEQA